RGKLWIKLNGLVKQRQCQVDRFPRSTMQMRHGAQVGIVGTEAASRLPLCTLDLGPLELRGDRSDDAVRDLILKLEDIVEPSFEPVGPKVRARRRVDELSRYANPVLGLAKTAFDDISHTKLASHLLLINHLALVSETGVAGDYEQPANMRQGGDD